MGGGVWSASWLLGMLKFRNPLSTAQQKWKPGFGLLRDCLECPSPTIHGPLPSNLCASMPIRKPGWKHLIRTNNQTMFLYSDSFPGWPMTWVDTFWSYVEIFSSTFKFWGLFIWRNWRSCLYSICLAIVMFKRLTYATGVAWSSISSLREWPCICYLHWYCSFHWPTVYKSKLEGQFQLN